MEKPDFIKVERYLMNNVQNKMPPSEYSGIFKKLLLSIRIALYQYVLNDGRDLACYHLEVCRKQIKEIFKAYYSHAPTRNTLEFLLCALNIIVDEYRPLKKTSGDFIYVQLSDLHITNGHEQTKSIYLSKLILSCFIVAKLLSLNWPTEMEDAGKKIDDSFKEKQAFLQTGMAAEDVFPNL